MTETELVQVLNRRFQISPELLQQISRPDFPKRLFKEVDVRQAHNLLMDLFNVSIVGARTMCEAEKAIIREVKSWENKSARLEHTCGCFFESELKSNIV